MNAFIRGLFDRPVDGGLPVAIKFLRFGLVGVTSGAIFGLVTHVMIDSLRVDPKVSALIGYVTAVPVNFVANRYFSFASKGEWISELKRFLIVHGTGVVVSYFIMLLFVDWMNAHHLIPIVLTILFLPLVNFVFLNLWVFRKT